MKDLPSIINLQSASPRSESLDLIRTMLVRLGFVATAVANHRYAHSGRNGVPPMCDVAKKDSPINHGRQKNQKEYDCRRSFHSYLQKKGRGGTTSEICSLARDVPRTHSRILTHYRLSFA